MLKLNFRSPTLTIIMTSQKFLNPPLTILPLENGDRLSRAEFERRYNALTEVKKAALIAGMVYSSPSC
ncbi:MAG: hypothetical protein WBL95_06805 [Microcoleus sp.]